MIRLLTAFAALVFALPVWASELGDDGLHKAAWFQDTFKDLQEDQAEAQAEGKQLLLIVEQRGCLYCKDMHEGAFMDARVLELLSDVYYPVQINLHGDTEMVDTDGEALSEKNAARKWGVLFTPTMVFLPPEVDFTKPATHQAEILKQLADYAGTTLDLMTCFLEHS